MADQRILIIDDEEDVGTFIVNVAEGLGFESRMATDFTVFKDTYHAFSPTVIFVDLQMPEMDGIEIMRELVELRCLVHVFVMSGMDGRVLKSALEYGRDRGLRVAGSFRKPFDIDDLETRLLALSKIDRKLPPPPKSNPTPP